MARVLLVEDEPTIASIIVFKLEPEGHQARWESSAVAVPAAAEANQPRAMEGAVATVAKPFKPTQPARLVAQLAPATAGGRP